MSKASFRAAIFDLDGTLVDSMSYWREMLERVLEEYGVTPDKEAKTTVSKMSLRQAAFYVKNRYCPEESAEKLRTAFLREQEDIYKKHCVLKAGVREYLQELKEQRIPMAVATMADKKHAKKALSRLGIKGFFTCVMTDEDVGKGKDSPALYLAVAKKLKVAPKDCAVFEDGVSYGLVAKQAGFAVYAVKDPCNEKQYADFASAVNGEAPWQ